MFVDGNMRLGANENLMRQKKLQIAETNRMIVVSKFKYY